MTGPQMKPGTTLLCIDFNGVSTLRKQLEAERAMQQFRRKQLHRFRLLDVGCNDLTPFIEEAERRLREVDLRVAKIERLLRWYGVDPRSPRGP